jgi:Ca-activated chloride channel family protein
MEASSRRRIVVVVLILLLLLLLLLLRCGRPEPETPAPVVAPGSVPAAATPRPAPPAPVAEEQAEVLTPATLAAPAQVDAGAAFRVSWTGPDNRSDYVVIVLADAPPSAVGSYQDTRTGNPLELVAPIEPGACELRYVSGRSKTILGRAPITVAPVGATLTAPDEALAGTTIQVAWTGPDNAGDYVTIVAEGTPEDQYGNYTDTKKGSPLALTMPVPAGAAELRYVSGQGRKVLARRAIRIVAAEVTLSAPEQALAGTTLQVTWTGPNNPGDYVTVVPDGTPDAQYGNYTDTSKGSPLALLLPIPAGAAELRYVSGQGSKVLARRVLRIVAAEVTLSAPDEAAAGTDVSLTWTGPNNPGDYLTIVTASTPDGQYGSYTNTTNGSPLIVKAPKDPGAAEVRYMTGQGNHVLARRPLRVVP